MGKQVKFLGTINRGAIHHVAFDIQVFMTPVPCLWTYQCVSDLSNILVPLQNQRTAVVFPPCPKEPIASFDKYYIATCNGLHCSLAKSPAEISSKVSIKAAPVQEPQEYASAFGAQATLKTKCKTQWYTMTQMPPACSMQALLGPSVFQPDWVTHVTWLGVTMNAKVQGPV